MMWTFVTVSVPPEPWNSDTYTRALAANCTPVVTSDAIAATATARSSGVHRAAAVRPDDSMMARAPVVRRERAVRFQQVEPGVVP